MGALLGLGGLHLVGRGGDLPTRVLQGLGRGGELLPRLALLLPQPLQLIGPAQDARAAGGRAAGHGAAGVEHLAVQGDDLEAVAVLPGHGDGLVQVGGDDGGPQQAGEDLLIAPLKGDELVAHAHEARLVHHADVPELPGADGAQGQEGGPSRVPALEVADGGLAVLLPLHHQVLHGAAQGDLDGHRVLVRHMEKSRHRAVDALEGAPLGLAHDQLDRLGVALVELFHLGEHMDAGGEVPVLHLQLHVLLAGLPGLLFAGLQPQGVAADDILDGVPVLLGLPQLMGHLFGLGAGLLQALLPRLQLFGHGRGAALQLLLGGGQGGEQGPGLPCRGALHGLPLAQGLHLVGQGARAASGGVGVALPRLQLLPELAHLFHDAGKALPALLDLAADGLGPALLGLQLPLDALGVFLVVVHIGAQHRDGVFQAVGVGGALHDLKADALRLHILLPHLLGEGLGGGVERLHLLSGLLLLPHRVIVVREELDGAGAQLLQLLQPHRDLQPPQLVAQDEELLGLFRLQPQRLHLQLQLVYLVVDAHQVLLGALQLALGLLLAVAEAGDARRLLKDLPPVGGTHREDLVDLALADDGVALPAQARVHEQLVDVLEAHRAAVDVILALPRAVVPPGDHDLALLHGEDMLGIVQHKRDLRKAQLLALGCAAEDHVLHLAAPQGPGGLLPHDPADGVGDIRFSAAVGAHDGGDVLAEGEHRLVREGLESLDLQRLEVQWPYSSPSLNPAAPRPECSA